MRLLLEGQVHVADPFLGESGRGRPRAGVEHGGATIDCRHELLCVLLAAARGQGGTPRREEAVLPVARGLRVGRDDRDAVAVEIRPVGNLLGVTLADDEDDDRVVGNRTVVVAILPVGADQPRLGDRLDVGPGGQRDDIGVEAVDDGAGLASRSGMRLLDRDGRSVLLLVVLGEGGVDVAVEFAGRVIRHVEKFDGLRPACRAAGSV